jgi:hypothetical protein
MRIRIVMNKVWPVLVLSLFPSGILYAEDPVHFTDLNLKAAVERELWTTDPTPTDMLGLTSLQAGSLDIRTISGLEYAKNLRTLGLRLNYVSDISPLSGLTELEYLVLHKNPVRDLSPLAGLTKLNYLNLNETQTTDISALSTLTNLGELILFYNKIHDVSPLLSMRFLTHLDLRLNPLDEAAYAVYIPQIIENNPGIRVQHDRGPFKLLISSTAGGTVISPGEGEYVVDSGDPVLIQAKADPCFVFVGFEGTLSASANPLNLLITQDHRIRAVFRSLLDTLYVDDDSAGDPGPSNAGISDPGENGTPEHPFDLIQEAIEVAATGATIFVRAGTYRETIDFLGKRIELTGFDPEDPNEAAWPVIDGHGNGPVVSFTHAEDRDCLLTGFVITGGRCQTGAAIRCLASSPTIANCLIVGNRATDWNGAAILGTDSKAAFINCTIAENQAGQFGAALRLVNSGVTIVNSILWGDAPMEIQTEGDETSSIRYSLVANGWPGTGNLKADPLFLSRGCWVDRDQPDKVVGPNYPNAVWLAGDYHLQSQMGRWDPKTAAWQQDPVTSPCIDAGDPATPVGQEIAPNGGIINLGAYGGTTEASKSRSNTLFP